MREKSRWYKRTMLALLLGLGLVLTPSVLDGAPSALATIEVYSGNYQTYLRASKRNLSIVINGGIGGNPNLQVISDTGADVTPISGQFTATTRRVTLRGEWLETLPNGTYQMTATYPNGKAIVTFYVGDKARIFFLEQPENVIVDPGDDATFSVRVGGSSSMTMTYQWQRRSRTGWKNVKGATTRIMTLKSVEEELTGYSFRCLVHTADGDAYSSVAKLYIIGAGDEEQPWLYALLSLLSLGGMVGCVLFRYGKGEGLKKRSELTKGR